MHTINHSEPDFWAPDPNGTPTKGTEQDALAQSALNSTRLAIARWTGGIHAPRMLEVGSLHVSPQARWYAQTRDGFEAWRAQGGFSQQDHARNARDEEYFVPNIDIRTSDAFVE